MPHAVSAPDSITGGSRSLPGLGSRQRGFPSIQERRLRSCRQDRGGQAPAKSPSLSGGVIGPPPPVDHMWLIWN